MTADPSAALAAIRARVDAATPGPWTVSRYEWGGGRIANDDTRTLVADLYDEGTREWFANARDDVRRMADALDAVLALHQPTPDDDDTGGAYWCTACGEDVCDGNYPCPTVAAITDALGGDR